LPGIPSALDLEDHDPPRRPMRDPPHRVRAEFRAALGEPFGSLQDLRAPVDRETAQLTEKLGKQRGSHPEQLEESLVGVGRHRAPRFTDPSDIADVRSRYLGAQQPMDVVSQTSPVFTGRLEPATGREGSGDPAQPALTEVSLSSGMASAA